MDGLLPLGVIGVIVILAALGALANLIGADSRLDEVAQRRGHL